MAEKFITKKAVWQVIEDYRAQLRVMPWQSLAGLTLPGIANIFVFYLPPLIIGKLVNDFAASGRVDLSVSLGYVALFTIAWLIGEALWRVGIHFIIRVETSGMNGLPKKAFSMLSEKDYEFYSNNFVGTLVKKAMAYSRNFEVIFDVLSFSVIAEIIPLIFAFYILAQYSLWIPTVLMVCIAIVVIVAIPIIKRRAKLVADRHDKGSKMVGRLSDALTNILAIKSFASEKEEYKKFGSHVNEFSKIYKKAGDYQNLRYDLIMSPLYVFTNTVGLLLSILFAQNLGLQAGVVVVVFAYYSRITGLFWNISRVYRNLESSVSEAAEFTQLFMDPPAIQDDPLAVPLIKKKGRIAFKDVGFKYETSKKDEDSFLENFNLEIKEGQRIGLVGPSGGGKTTITKLLLRFVDADSGDIRVDSQSIKKVTQESLRKAIAYVPQEPLLFHRSLKENIAYGNDNATEKDITRAAKLAHAHDFISQLPDGYETLVGERGIKLSGGQRQRVAIARALLKDAPILILDEATSSLDSESEKYIQEGLWELMKGKTAIVIAHRLSTIKHMDRILVLENGEIVQDGTHEELLSKEGLYKKLWGHQTESALKSSKSVLA